MLVGVPILATEIQWKYEISGYIEVRKQYVQEA